MIKAGLYAFLSTQAAIIAIVQDRIYPGVIPTEVFDAASQKPCLTYQREDKQREQTLCATESLTKSSFRITAYSRDDGEAQRLADAVEDAILDYRGLMGTTNVHTVSLDGEFEGVDIEPGLFRVDLLLSIWHSHP